MIPAIRTQISKQRRPGPFSILCTPKRDGGREGREVPNFRCDCRNLVTLHFFPTGIQTQLSGDSKYAGPGRS